MWFAFETTLIVISTTNSLWDNRQEQSKFHRSKHRSFIKTTSFDWKSENSVRDFLLFSIVKSKKIGIGCCRVIWTTFNVDQFLLSNNFRFVFVIKRGVITHVVQVKLRDETFLFCLRREKKRKSSSLIFDLF